MITNIDSVVKKYARAFINTNRVLITPTIIDQCRTLKRLLDARRHAINTLSVSSISATKKFAYIEHFLNATGLGAEFKLLADVLIQHHRLFYLSSIMKSIIAEYQHDARIAVFTISTSHALHEDEKAHVLTFIQRTLPEHTIEAHFDVQPNLISGIRIKSDTLLWERSLPKLLRQIKQTLFQRVAL